jgi:ABC-2 type transport system ATP-binding protein
MADAVVVAGLRKSYGSVQAVREVSLTVGQGEIVALLGPNGAGKSTTLEILEGFRQRDGGRVEVLGLDPGDKAVGRELRERTGVVLQDIAVEPYLTVAETIARDAGYYPAPRDVGEVIELVGLTEQRRRTVRLLSGGQKRRLDVALGLIGNPELLLLDEALADRVVLLSGGVVVADGSPGSLGGRDTQQTRITFGLPAGFTIADLPIADSAVSSAADGRLVVQTSAPTAVLQQLTAWALQHGRELAGLTVGRPSLEEAYLQLTHHVEPADAPEGSTR